MAPPTQAQRLDELEQNFSRMQETFKKQEENQKTMGDRMEKMMEEMMKFREEWKASEKARGKETLRSTGSTPHEKGSSEMSFGDLGPTMGVGVEGSLRPPIPRQYGLPPLLSSPPEGRLNQFTIGQLGTGILGHGYSSSPSYGVGVMGTRHATPPVIQMSVTGEENLQGRQSWRFRKLDLPLFEGSNPDGWIMRMERYFHFYRLEGLEQMEAAVVALEGDALLWFQFESRRRSIGGWEDLKLMILHQFRPTDTGSLYEQWLSLIQTGD